MTEASTRIDIPITSAPPVSNSTSNSNTSSALLRKYPMIEADQKRRRYRRIIFICVSLVLIALGATFALFAALGLLSNENGFLSSKSRLPGGMAHPDSEIGKDTKSVNINLEKSTDNWDWSSSLIVISIDGFHPSYLMNTNAQHLRRFGINVHRIMNFNFFIFIFR